MSNGKWPVNVRVEVEWVDSCTRGNWDSLERHRKESRPSRCRSIGYLIESSDRCITVAQSMSTDSQNISDTMSIPRKAITRVRRIQGLK